MCVCVCHSRDYALPDFGDDVGRVDGEDTVLEREDLHAARTLDRARDAISGQVSKAAAASRECACESVRESF